MTPVPHLCHLPVPSRAGGRANPVPARLARPTAGGLTCTDGRHGLHGPDQPCHPVPAVPGWFR